MNEVCGWIEVVYKDRWKFGMWKKEVFVRCMKVFF